MAARSTWRASEELAWTEKDGPGRPPGGPPRWQTSGMSVLTAGVLVGMLSTDTLCPEHRAWVLGLGSLGLAAILASAIGLWRGWASGPALSLVGALSGVAIGLIDTTHAVGRGSLIAGAFAVLAVGAMWLVWKQLQAIAWDRQVDRELSVPPLPMGAPEPPSPRVDAPAAERSKQPSLSE